MKKLSLIACIVLLFVSVIHQISAEEQVIVVAATEWSPYMSEQLPDKGIVVEITRVAFEKAGYKAVFKFYPWKRLLLLTENGMVDAAMGVSYTEERTTSFLYPTHTTFEDRKVIFYNNNKEVIETFTGDLHDLCPHHVGVLRGSYLAGRLKDVGCVSIDPATTVESNLKKLLIGRFRYLLESEVSIKLLLSNQTFSDTERNSISMYDTPFEKDKNYTVFSKKAVEQKPELQLVLEAFDKSLAQIKEDGTYEKILRDHKMEVRDSDH